MGGWARRYVTNGLDWAANGAVVLRWIQKYTSGPVEKVGSVQVPKVSPFLEMRRVKTETTIPKDCSCSCHNIHQHILHASCYFQHACH